MNTKVIKIDEDDCINEQMREAGEIIRRGGIVAFPTETVYGLGASALDAEAVEKIFKAKGRPQDNPLIVHIADIGWVDRLCIDIPDNARVIMNKFWPGPLTVVLKKQNIIPDVVTCSLNTVGIRMPSHPIAKQLILSADVPIAAPSANLSGRPSPTCPEHVIEDLSGRADMIMCGGSCGVGVESTVIDMTQMPPRLLRPGGVTLEQLEQVLGEVAVDAGVLRTLKEGEVARAPGMKYRHYAPKATVIIVSGEEEKVLEYIEQQCGGRKCGILCFDENSNRLKKLTGCVIYSYGSEKNEKELARNLFFALRAFDKTDVEVIYAQCPPNSGLSLAVANRLKKAAGFRIVNV